MFVRIIGHPDGAALGEHNPPLPKGKRQKRQYEQRENENNGWSSHAIHGSFLLVNAEHRPAFAVGGIDQRAMALPRIRRAACSGEVSDLLDTVLQRHSLYDLGKVV